MAETTLRRTDLGKRPLRDLEVGSGTIRQGSWEFLISGALSQTWGGHELQMASQTPSPMNMDKKFRMGPFKLRAQGKSQSSSFPSLSVLLTASTFPISTQMKTSYLAHRFDSMFWSYGDISISTYLLSRSRSSISMSISTSISIYPHVNVCVYMIYTYVYECVYLYLSMYMCLSVCLFIPPSNYICNTVETDISNIISWKVLAPWII